MRPSRGNTLGEQNEPCGVGDWVRAISQPRPSRWHPRARRAYYRRIEHARAGWNVKTLDEIVNERTRLRADQRA